MLRCWQKSPDDRPSFEELHEMLKDILKEDGVRMLTLLLLQNLRAIFTMNSSNLYHYHYNHYLIIIIIIITYQRQGRKSLDAKMTMPSISYGSEKMQRCVM